MRFITLTPTDPALDTPECIAWLATVEWQVEERLLKELHDELAAVGVIPKPQP